MGGAKWKQGVAALQNRRFLLRWLPYLNRKTCADDVTRRCHGDFNSLVNTETTQAHMCAKLTGLSKACMRVFPIVVRSWWLEVSKRLGRDSLPS